MLKITKNITVNGESKIGDVATVYMTANVSVGNTSVNKSIIDEAKYKANKTELDKDITDFEKMVSEIESELRGEVI